MYKIIGADQKEYGPISGDELRQWIGEGRVNGQTPIQAGGETAWKSVAEFPEFAAALAASPSAAMPPLAAADHSTLPVDVAERDYDLDIGSCISRSWALVKYNFWPVVGVTFLIIMCTGVINHFIGLISAPAIQEMMETKQITPRGVMLVILTSVLSAPFQVLFTAGLFRYYLKLIRGQATEMSDAFSGFTVAPGQLLLLCVVSTLLQWLGFCLCVLPGIYLGVAWVFSIPLVIDKQLEFWPAMELSRKVVSRHWFVILGLMLLNGLVSLAGLAACCVGIFVSIPVGIISLMYAYEDLFGHRKTTA